MNKKEQAYMILCEQIDGHKKRLEEIREEKGVFDQKLWGLISALMEGAKSLNIDLNSQAAALQAAENVAKKNFRIIERNMAIDALYMIPKEDFNYNTVCNVIRNLPFMSIKTDKEFENFMSAALKMSESYEKEQLEKMEEDKD